MTTERELLEQMAEALRASYPDLGCAKMYKDALAAYDSYISQPGRELVAEMNAKQLGGKQWVYDHKPTDRTLGADGHFEDCRVAGRGYERNSYNCTCKREGKESL